MTTTDDTSNQALAHRYAAIPYDALPHRATHPARLATVAALMGHAAADPERCCVLEVGCNTGWNLIAMAVSLPAARFVGCDISMQAIAEGRRAIEALGLTNVTLVPCDLTALPPEHGPFDFIVAHGVYSWVPRPVRDALFDLAEARLAPAGVLYVSYNVLPGCRVRQAVWDTLHHHVDHIEDAHARLAAARQIARLVADGGSSVLPADDAVRTEFRAIAQRSDSELCHDDLAVPNEPVLFETLARHAADHDLRYLAEAEPTAMGTAGVSAEARSTLAPLDLAARQQALDFLLLRRFRQSLLVRTQAPHGATRLRDLYMSAGGELMRAAAAGEVHKLAKRLDPASGGGGALRKLLDELASHQPAAIPVATLQDRHEAGAGSRLSDSLVLDACQAGIVELHVVPPAVAATAGDRPVASPLARQEARTGDRVTSLLHMSVSLADANALRLLPLVDGTRDRAGLARAVRELGLPIDASRAADFVAYSLAKFARLGLLMPESLPAAARA